MDSSKHIFIQIDTNSILTGAGANLPTNKLVSEHSFIYDQGSMVMGKPEKTFSIEVVSGMDVYFTILPLQLFSRNKLYFTKFEVISSNDDISFKDNVLPVIDDHAVSFKATIEKALPGGEINFSLGAAIEYQIAGEYIPVPICIDPVLRVKQGTPQI
ncbi:MAG TPA: hypothetical protein VF676_11130 [Flavobacterium sp.]|jgi:hypothetical protein